MDLRNIDPIAAENAFREKMAEAGLVPPDGLRTDGKITRVHVDGKKGKRDGWYVYFADGLCAGAYGDWHDGEAGWQTWCAADTKTLSNAEYLEHKARLDRARTARRQEAERVQKDAQDAADALWDAAKPAESSHPYLERKRVQAHGLRVHTDGRLVVPIRDGEGQIWSIEFIGDAGEKRFLPGGRKGGLWFELGEPGQVLCVAEGYATAASVHEATGYFVAVAFDCGNLARVAKALRDKHPTAKIVICADDDQKTKGNPGLTSAQKAAKECNGLVAIPAQAGDFNDQAVALGGCSVAETVNKALAADTGPIDAADLFPLVYAELEARKEGRSKSSISTGIGSVDKLTGGLRRGYLSIVAGLPGSGKTAAAIGILAHNAQGGVPCLLFSIEMDRLDIGMRFVSQRSCVPATTLFSERTPMDKRQWDYARTAADDLSRALLTIDDRAVTLSQLIEQSHKWYADKVRSAGKETGMISVDYLGLIRSEEGSENRNREVAAMSQGLKLLARTLRVPVLLCAQLNRQASANGGEPELSHLRDSGEIAEAADLVLFPYQWPRYMNSDGEMVMKPAGENEEAVDKWLVRKNRNGPKGAAAVKWNAEIMLYTGIGHDEFNQGCDRA
jgi:phage/plasmid primase-like uncharacterized protein/replicative DNA helicase